MRCQRSAKENKTCEASPPYVAKSSRRGAGIWHLLLKLGKTFTFLVYLLMQLLSTALVVPIVQSFAESMRCVFPEGTDWTEMLMGNPWLGSSLKKASTGGTNLVG